MGNLIVNKVKYFGDKYFYQSPDLSSGLNIIEGENRNGKTTFMDLIYYGFGGAVKKFDIFNKNNTKKHNEISTDSNNYVELDVSLNQQRYILRRYIGRNNIWYAGKGDDSDSLPVNRGKNAKNIFSDWLLEKLEIDVVDIYQGEQTQKLNAKDLFRLIYHDQEPDPEKIFKKPDLDNYIADSRQVRQVIFRILLGKSYADYYEALSKFKELEKKRNTAKAVLEEFNQLATKLINREQDFNVVYLKQAISEKENTLISLYKTRESLKNTRPGTNQVNLLKVSELKAKLIQEEISHRAKKEKEQRLYRDKQKYEKYKANLILEVNQLSKIIHTHDNLSLFADDTCPYCLREFKRPKDTCVCGQKIDGEYEKFFYSSEEYWEILKSRKKSVETVDAALELVNSSLNELQGEQKIIGATTDELKEKINVLLVDLGNNVDVNRLNEIDDKILEVKTEISELQQKIEIENKREEHQKELNKVESNFQKAKSKKEKLEGEAKGDMVSKIDGFNTIYNEFMTQTLKDCKSAKISYDDYMPIIDGGIYREASSSVTIRLMYYLTLLRLSLKEKGMNFPKFLLIDTPRTAGIDESQIIKAIKQIQNIIPENFTGQYQVILATGTNTYPPEFKTNVFETLADDKKLLRKQEV